MRNLKYDFNISKAAIQTTFNRLINQVYKLLPLREEGADWQKPLTTILVELSGMDRLFVDQHHIFFPLICKLEGLFNLTEEDMTLLYESSKNKLTEIEKELKELGYYDQTRRKT